MTKKYEFPEEPSANNKGFGFEQKPQIVSESVAAYAVQEQPVMHVIKRDVSLETNKEDEPFDLTEEQVTQILDMSDKAFAQGKVKVYSHADVMNHVRHYEYGHSLV